MNPLIEEAQAIYQAAVRSVQADRLMESVDLGLLLGRPLTAFRRIFVVGTGKASMAMAGAVEHLLNGCLDQGLVVVPHGYRATLPTSQHRPAAVQVVEAGHPVPDQSGVSATRQVLALAEACERDDLLLVLISGGGSSLWTAPAEGLTLEAAQHTVRLLLHSGATIHEFNTVRKHLSRIKGGYLAQAAYPATVLTLVVSDVVGNDLSVIASGPTIPDRTTFADAVRVLESYGLWEHVPTEVQAHLVQGCKGRVAETPKLDDPCFTKAPTVLLGSNRGALHAAHTEASAYGYTTRIMDSELQGEAREVGRAVVQKALQVASNQPVCLLWGGETTVTVTGHGLGGRNQEVALAAALALEGCSRKMVVLSGGTDGIDGPTKAAGAWATSQTNLQARRLGLDPRRYLADNDAYRFFQQGDGLLFTGPTHTNVMDIVIALVAPEPV